MSALSAASPADAGAVWEFWKALVAAMPAISDEEAEAAFQDGFDAPLAPRRPCVMPGTGKPWVPSPIVRIGNATYSVYNCSPAEIKQAWAKARKRGWLYAD